MGKLTITLPMVTRSTMPVTIHSITSAPVYIVPNSHEHIILKNGKEKLCVKVGKEILLIPRWNVITKSGVWKEV